MFCLSSLRTTDMFSGWTCSLSNIASEDCNYITVSPPNSQQHPSSESHPSTTHLTSPHSVHCLLGTGRCLLGVALSGPGTPVSSSVPQCRLCTRPKMNWRNQEERRNCLIVNKRRWVIRSAMSGSRELSGGSPPYPSSHLPSMVRGEGRGTWVTFCGCSVVWESGLVD